MTKEEILKKIDEIEDKMWWMEMGDFIDWVAYRKLQDEKDRLKATLKSL